MLRVHSRPYSAIASAAATHGELKNAFAMLRHGCVCYLLWLVNIRQENYSSQICTTIFCLRCSTDVQWQSIYLDRMRFFEALRSTLVRSYSKSMDHNKWTHHMMSQWLRMKMLRFRNRIKLAMTTDCFINPQIEPHWGDFIPPILELVVFIRAIAGTKMTDTHLRFPIERPTNIFRIRFVQSIIVHRHWIHLCTCCTYSNWQCNTRQTEWNS